MRAHVRALVFLSAVLAHALLVPASLGSTSDGIVIGAVKIFDRGPEAERFNIVLLAEGYRESELGQFAEDAQDFADFLLTTSPFSTNCSAYNIWRVDVSSTESGADDPVACDGTGADVDTYFDATFCGDGVIRRLLVANGATALDVLNAQVPDWNHSLIIVNSSSFGGSGGSVAVTSVSGVWENIAVHELGHAAFGLADEYEYWAGCGIDTDRDNHPMSEPAEPNVTIETDRMLVKWADLINAATPVPTTLNADCTMCDPQLNPYPGTTVVGLYEGAHYFHCGAFRPAFDCMMRNFARFCPVCTRRIRQTFAPFEPPNSAPACHAGGPYAAECAGAATPVLLDAGGSSDFDCNPLSYSWSGPFAGGTAMGPSPLVSFSDLGSHEVDLEVSDGASSSSCSANVLIQDSLAPFVTAPPDVVAECTSPDGASADLGTASVVDVCDLTVLVGNDAPDTFPFGATIVTWTGTDDSGNTGSAFQKIIVQDTTSPAVNVSISPSVLWPPNHHLVPIRTSIFVLDSCAPSPTIRLVSIASSEPDDTKADIQGAELGTDDRFFYLRAERHGGGEGRVYTIAYEVVDASGNAAMARAHVRVPHNQ